jgi:hypothetical protein
MCKTAALTGVSMSSDGPVRSWSLTLFSSSILCGGMNGCGLYFNKKLNVCNAESAKQCNPASPTAMKMCFLKYLLSEMHLCI